MHNPHTDRERCNCGIRGFGRIAQGVSELIIAVLTQAADMERQRIRARTTGGRELARTTLAVVGKTHRGKESLIMVKPKLFARDVCDIAPASSRQPISYTNRFQP